MLGTVTELIHPTHLVNVAVKVFAETSKKRQNASWMPDSQGK